jgi:pimeloyl-ACP methyl ester carboxylesterase
MTRLLLLTASIFIAWNLQAQTPHPPYPYHSDSVEYDNADKSVHLAATLTYPEKGGPFPAAILITGSGTQDRDETLFGHRPFAVIADYLTRRGYAVLRVDDRNAGLSTGDVYHATTADFAKDVETSFHWLKMQKQVDPTKIGLIGHSEGAMIAPMVAAQNNDIAFIINLAGALDGYRTLMYQTLEPLRRSHTGDLLIGFAMFKERMFLDNMKLATDSAGFMQRVTHDYEAYYAAIPDSMRSQYAFVPKPDVFLHALAPIAHHLVAPWWKFFITTDLTHYYEKVRCPVLLLGGDKDIQVDNAADMTAIASILKDHHNKNVETHLVPGLNHFFQHCHSCAVQEYGKLEETFAPEVLQLMADWLDKTIR